MNQLPEWLTLWRMPGVGPHTFNEIVAQFPQLQELFETTPAQLKTLGLNQRLQTTLTRLLQGKDKQIRAGVEADLAWLQESAKHHIVCYCDSDYPNQLKTTQNAPPLLFVAGEKSCLGLPQLAIVGSRHCSRSGQKNSQQFARYFADSGFVVVSGLALGVDTAAHQGALEAKGITVAVLAHGLDSLYPRRNQELADALQHQGALVSEMPIGTKPRPEFFPRRNRIISGLSLGVLVVEATRKSGSLITAYEALEQGREVFALPGNIHDPLAKGCHELIRRGAKLVENGTDVVTELGALLGYMEQESLIQSAVPSVSRGQYLADSVEAKILQVIEYTPLSTDQIIIATGCSAIDVGSALVIMELNGDIQMTTGGYQRC